MPDPSSGWPARFVVMVQLAAWCTVGALLLHMGMASLTPEAAAAALGTNSTAFPGDDEVAANDTAAGRADEPPPAKKKSSPQYRPSSVLMITVGSTMLILGPVVLMIREIESRRQYDRFTKVDPPPSYDEVTEAAPRYSTLFEVDESGELVPINAPSSPPPRDRTAAPQQEAAGGGSLLLKPRTNSAV